MEWAFDLAFCPNCFANGNNACKNAIIVSTMGCLYLFLGDTCAIYTPVLRAALLLFGFKFGNRITWFWNGYLTVFPDDRLKERPTVRA
jgi:hypothetical protein